jgi:hypothetical protein
MNASMLIIKSDWGGKPTFRMIPANKECPYVECIFDPESKVLAVISSTKKNIMHMMTKIDDNGDPVKRKIVAPGVNPYKEERKTIETFQEYYITDSEEIKEFVKMFAINADYFNKFVELLSTLSATGA